MSQKGRAQLKIFRRKTAEYFWQQGFRLSGLEKKEEETLLLSVGNRGGEKLEGDSVNEIYSRRGLFLDFLRGGPVLIVGRNRSAQSLTRISRKGWPRVQIACRKKETTASAKRSSGPARLRPKN